MNKWIVSWKYGWPWGLFMFVVVEVLPIARGKREFDPLIFVVGLLIWSIGALWCGYIIQRIKNRAG